MSKTDMVIVVKFNPNKPKNALVKTNAKKEAVAEILENWIRSQMGTGKDPAKVSVKDTYKIVIKLDLDGDVFHTSSDTGNKCLTCGIIMNIFSNLEKIPIRRLV